MSAVHNLVRHAHYMLSVIRSGETLTTEEERQVRKACVDALMDADATVALRAALEEGAAWLESRPDFTEGDAATASRMRALTAHPAPTEQGLDS